MDLAIRIDSLSPTPIELMAKASGITVQRAISLYAQVQSETQVYHNDKKGNRVNVRI